ncbi:hypothetical protein [Segniliparus rugosus]|uniref:Uncharacterized protein n=1 Tax=Segniliparus rugosus (strain ATCC BAA-974 / DSM 45345 / CCUG 50838 / CIP 108380 / JCM 13579 / CDC 945) TaxID=679197 RepID=E5XTZ6_SEGRC|nr:hypothetical protein [Segniliparus rugosus]EFV12165.1 hypothetical protein HMPREF9336_02968 [Segniliparus rugosus ATCC BAA-974]
MQISRALVLSLPLLAAQAPAAFAAPSTDCAVFKGADADLTTLAGALRTISNVVADNASAQDKHEASQTTGETLVKTGDILANVAASVSDSGYRKTVSDYSDSIKQLGQVIESIDGTPDEATTHKAQDLAKRVDSLSGDYDKAHEAACAG